MIEYNAAEWLAPGAVNGGVYDSGGIFIAPVDAPPACLVSALRSTAPVAYLLRRRSHLSATWHGNTIWLFNTSEVLVTRMED